MTQLEIIHGKLLSDLQDELEKAEENQVLLLAAIDKIKYDKALIVSSAAEAVAVALPLKEVYVAEIESLSSVLRVFFLGEHYGDPYLWHCVVRWITPKEVELMAISEFPDISMRHAIAEAMLKVGATHGYFTRVRDGEKRQVAFDFEELVNRHRGKKLPVLEASVVLHPEADALIKKVKPI